MLRQNKVFYNAVIDLDLFFTMYDYLRFNPGVAKEYKVFSTLDFDNLTLEDWKDLGDDTLRWLECMQYPKVHLMLEDEASPTADTWGTLYYQTLNYMGIVYPKYLKTIRTMTFDETKQVCKDCIEYLKEKVKEIREPNDEDI